MWSKRTFGASGYAEAQESGVEPTHSNCACADHTCADHTWADHTCADRACSSRVRIAGAGRHTRN